ncbi:MAG: SpoIIE family protein phosphatase [Streptosporangiaceae bacterium]
MDASSMLAATARSVRASEPGHLLLVEDDAGDALLVEELLADSGVRSRLTWVRSLEAAKQTLAVDPPGCVLLDLHLGDAHGLTALETVLVEAPEAAVIVLTGLSEAQAGLTAVAAGAQDYLVKGQLEPEWLARAIRYAVQRKLVEQTSAALQVSRLLSAENARLERGLLPQALVSNQDFQLTTRYRSGRAHSLLGGDFLDVVETGDGSIHAVIGDVAGHGPAEAALGVCLRVAWRSLVLAGVTGGRLIGLLEEILLAERDGQEVFTTLTTLVFSPDRSAVRVVRCGHPGMLLREDGVKLVEIAGGLALGLMPGEGRWVEELLSLRPGSSLVLFTDGLFEGRTGDDRERLDVEGLLELAKAHHDKDPEAFVDALIDDAEAASADFGGLDDDVAVLHLGWKVS